MDAASGETILKIGVGTDSCFLICFHLYDSNGCRAAESAGISPFPGGVRIDSCDGELLLGIPAELDANIQYRLYNRSGELLTSSDGVCTRIGPCLRMEGWPRRGARRHTTPIGVDPNQTPVVIASGLKGTAA